MADGEGILEAYSIGERSMRVRMCYARFANALRLQVERFNLTHLQMDYPACKCRKAHLQMKCIYR